MLTMCAQERSDDAFEEMLDGLIKGTVEQITTQQLQKSEEEFTFLDARPKEEFDVGHIKEALRIGFKDFDKSTVADLPKDRPIVVYCSVGYRSERVGEKLKKLGFTQVYNLRGGIFDWFNRGLPVFDKDGESNEVHPYDRKWGKWVKERAK